MAKRFRQNTASPPRYPCQDAEQIDVQTCHLLALLHTTEHEYAFPLHLCNSQNKAAAKPKPAQRDKHFVLQRPFQQRLVKQIVHI